jgi:hypothetical protein
MINAFQFSGLAFTMAKSVTGIHNSNPTRQKNLLNTISAIHARAMERANETPGTNTTVSLPVTLDAITAAYLQAYVEGKFVDRTGTTISKPVIENQIGNDTLVGFETVILSAIFDYATMTPVLYDASKQSSTTQSTTADRLASSTPAASGSDGTNSTSGATPKPTFAVLFPDLYQPLLQDIAFGGNKARDGITASENGLITFLSGIGSEQSKQLSNLIVKSLGGVNAGPVFVLGKISVGDNETISKAVSTFCSVFVGDVVATLNYDFFSQFRYSVDANGRFTISDADDQNNESRLYINRTQGQVVADALQYQSLLIDLFSKASNKSSGSGSGR